MADTRRVNVEAVKRVLMADESTLGVFEQAIGFRPATGSYKPVHLMNDLAQSVLGGAPSHGGDFLAHVTRAHVAKDDDKEDNSERAMRAHDRFGSAFNRAFPQALGGPRIDALRRAAHEVLSFDAGVYAPGTSMCSPLAPHRDLLGFEGFRRFGVGRLLADVLPKEGAEKLRSLFESDRDPITRALRPIVLRAPLVEKQKPREPVTRSAFDVSLGKGLTSLLSQQLTKSYTLRAVALGGSLGVVLKVLGAGRPNGRPALLALANSDEKSGRPLREPAVVSFRRGIEALDARVAALMPAHPNAGDLLKPPEAKQPSLEVSNERKLNALAFVVLSAAREHADDFDIYLPDTFIARFGPRVGCVLPKGRSRWGRHFALTPELVEVLVLMLLGRGETATWSSFWTRVAAEFGVHIGANPSKDVEALAAIGVDNVSPEDLIENSEALLSLAVRRGVARRLPDGEAEVGGELS
jgi:hypothetical protein